MIGQRSAHHADWAPVKIGAKVERHTGEAVTPSLFGVSCEVSASQRSTVEASTANTNGQPRGRCALLDHPETRELIDFDEPVGVLMMAMIHFLADEERPGVMGSLRAALAPGSYLAATHCTKDGKSPEVVAQVESVYANTARRPRWAPRTL